MTKIKCAVTGSGGYVGSYFIKKMREDEGLTVYEMGRNKQIPFSLGQKNPLPELTGVDVLIHCAYDFTLNNFEEIYQINVLGTLELFRHAKQSGVKKIIFISSMSAFPGTRSNYGKAKLLIEEKAQEIGFIILRPGLIFSKNPSGIFGAIAKFIQLSPIVPLLGLGQQLFYPCYLENLFQVITILIKGEYRNFTAPIIAASKNPVTFKKMLRVIAATNKKKVFLFPLPYQFLYFSMRMLEMLNLKSGLRADSLVGAHFYDKSDHDFKFIEENKLEFINLDEQALSQVTD